MCVCVRASVRVCVYVCVCVCVCVCVMGPPTAALETTQSSHAGKLGQKAAAEDRIRVTLMFWDGTVHETGLRPQNITLLVLQTIICVDDLIRLLLMKTS